MSLSRNIPTPGAPREINLQFIAKPAEGLATEDITERFDDRGQDYEVTPEGIKVLDEVFVNGLYLDHSEADEGELVWVCEFCSAYSRTKAIVEAHEATCADNPDKEN